MYIIYIIINKDIHKQRCRVFQTIDSVSFAVIFHFAFFGAFLYIFIAQVSIIQVCSVSQQNSTNFMNFYSSR